VCVSACVLSGFSIYISVCLCSNSENRIQIKWQEMIFYFENRLMVVDILNRAASVNPLTYASVLGCHLC
jgi:hypothetical protein